ncbi:glycosyltransferase family 4 protein [Candidatus Uhrbacteria bacterium]|nr:glycosyltransferase family 4 protein [Candidatus Uhrbacteria bacterium]
MRIAHVVSTYPPYRGGMGNVAWELATRTAAWGHTVTVMTPAAGRASSTARGDTKCDGEVVPVTAWLRHGNAAWCPGMRTALEDHRVDVVHLHWPFIWGIAPLLAWRRHHPQRRLVVQYHMDLMARGVRAPLFGGYQWWTLRRLLPVADRVVMSSWDYARHGALASYLRSPNHRGVVIPLGVDGERFTPIDRAMCTSPCTLLFVGGLDRAHAFKGVRVLLAALAAAPGVHLRIVGDGDLRAAFVARAAALGIGERVEFCGAVDAATLVATYQAADVVVLPSIARSEAFGLVLLEGMAAGVPVIASRLPGVRTLVEEGVTGFLVPPGHVDALAARLRWCAAHRDLLRRMGRQARERVMVSYVWSAIVPQWEMLYHEVCDERIGSR